MPEDLVLTTRLAVTKTNLTLINALTTTIRRREDGIDDFLGAPAQHLQSLAKLNEKVFKLKNQAFEDEEVFLKDLKLLEEDVDNLAMELRKRNRQADALRTLLFEPLNERNDVTDFLLTAAKGLESQLTPENYWKKQTECEKLFREYVDLLRGIALRSARFGDKHATIGQLFSIADALPDVWGRVNGWGWHSLVVPSRIEEHGSTDSLVLRVGFPEWTVWALPVLQHEMAHVYRARKDLNRGDKPPDASLVADALATLVTRPAYACATLLLRLNPSAVLDPDSEAGLRAATILGTLSECSEEGDPVHVLAARLRREWLAAVENAGGEPDAQTAAFASSKWSDALRTAREDVELAERGGLPKAPVWHEKWPTVSLLASVLSEGGDVKVPPAYAGESEMGDAQKRSMSLLLMLNAVWLARVGPKPERDAAPGDIAGIAERAVRAMLDHLEGPPPRRRGSGPTNVR